jgi:hypothetical protein
MAALDMPVPAIELSVFSSGMSKGIAQTEGPQVRAEGELRSGPLHVGGFVRNLTSGDAGGDGAVDLGVRAKLGGFDVAASAAFRFTIDPAKGSDSKAFELAGSLGRRMGRFRPTLSVIYSPDDLGSARRSFFVDGRVAYAISDKLSASVALGRRDRVDGHDYDAWNGGLSWSPAKWASFDARYYGNSRSSGWQYGQRFVVGGAIRFRPNRR